MPDRALHVSRSRLIWWLANCYRRVVPLADRVSAQVRRSVGVVVAGNQWRPWLRQFSRISRLWLSGYLARHRDAGPAAVLHPGDRAQPLTTENSDQPSLPD